MVTMHWCVVVPQEIGNCTNMPLTLWVVIWGLMIIEYIVTMLLTDEKYFCPVICCCVLFGHLGRWLPDASKRNYVGRSAKI
jgi:hypothetical protein